MRKIIKFIFPKFKLLFDKNMKLLKLFIFNNLNLIKYKLYKIKNRRNISNTKIKINLSHNEYRLSKRNKVFFIYRSFRKNNGSTVMRVFQLQKILKHEGGINTEIIDEKSINNIHESICILNKSFLIDASAEEFEILKSNKNILCLDYIDLKEKLFQIKYSHCLIASSIKQLLLFKKKYKSYQTHLITHHVDPRLKKDDKKIKSLRIGYFGEKKNGLYIDQLNNFIEPHFIKTNTQSNKTWFKEINNFNAHYIIRKSIDKNINKPFLKGFTAAFTSSNVLICENEGDSLFYLTEDYPYLIKDRSLESIIKMIHYMQATYNSKIWYEGLEIMEDVKFRTSNKQIIKEFKLMLKLIM